MAGSREKADSSRKARQKRDLPLQPEREEPTTGSGPAKETDLLTHLQQTAGNQAVARVLQTVPAHAAHRPLALLLGPTGSGLQRQPQVTAPPSGRTVFKPVARQSYTITAKTLKEAVDQIQLRDEAGETTWHPTYSVTTDDSGQVTGATVEVQITVTMPNWPGAAKLKPADKAKWDKFVQALEAHEQGHVDLVKDKLKDLGSKLLGKSKDDADATFQSALTDLQTASDDYDTKTDHGRNTGCTIDVDDDSQQSADDSSGSDVAVAVNADDSSDPDEDSADT
jgi:hypothetical protein